MEGYVGLFYEKNIMQNLSIVSTIKLNIHTMKKILKRVGIILLFLLGILLLFYGYINLNFNNKITKKYSYEPHMITLAVDSASVARGEHLVNIKGCRDCHGENLGGKVFIDDPTLGRFAATNLTSGTGGIANDYTDADWFRALQHGVDNEGKALIIMPSYETTLLSDEDMANMVVYIKSLPAVYHILPENNIKPLAKILTFFNQLPTFAVERIDHKQKRIAKVEPSEDPSYGKYLTVACHGCHRENLKGGKHPVPGAAMVPDITSSSRIGNISEEQFTKILREGITPDGRVLKVSDMPWNMTQSFTDMEIKAIYNYLQSI